MRAPASGTWGCAPPGSREASSSHPLAELAPHTRAPSAPAFVSSRRRGGRRRRPPGRPRRRPQTRGSSRCRAACVCQRIGGRERCQDRGEVTGVRMEGQGRGWTEPPLTTVMPDPLPRGHGQGLGGTRGRGGCQGGWEATGRARLAHAHWRHLQPSPASLTFA